MTRSGLDDLLQLFSTFISHTCNLRTLGGCKLLVCSVKVKISDSVISSHFPMMPQHLSYGSREIAKMQLRECK